MSVIKQAAVIGGGVIGGGWAARFVLNGINVKVFDPHPEVERRLNEMLVNAERAWSKLTLAPLGKRGSITFTDSIAEAVTDAGFIQESTPEDETLKRRILREIDEAAPVDTPIGSSTSGLLPSKLQAHMAQPERFMAAHPFNPVYLLPLVELCGGDQTAREFIDQAATFYESLGMRPLKLRKEIDGFLADRLLEAVWRESLWLVHDDVATVEEIDDALRFGAGPRWALMGSFLTYRIAGGEEGMRHFMAQFGPALKWPWTKLMDVPELTDAFLDKLAEQSDEQAAGQSIRELERRRDDGLIAILQGLRTQDWGAGSVLKAHEERLYSRFHAQAAKAEPDLSQPFSLHQGTVPPEWLDYNGHMNESRYLQVFGDATDAVLGFIGLNADYLASGRSIYTVETHIRHLAETRVSTAFHVTTQVLGQDEKRIHLWHEMFRSEDHTLLATGEHMLLHVDTHAGRSCPMEPELLAKAQAIAEGHRGLPRPEAAGRAIRVLRPTA